MISSYEKKLIAFRQSFLEMLGLSKPALYFETGSSMVDRVTIGHQN